MKETVLIQGDMGIYKKAKTISVIVLILTLILGGLLLFIQVKYTSYDALEHTSWMTYKEGYTTKSHYEARSKEIRAEQDKLVAPRTITILLGIVSLGTLAYYFEVLVSSKKMSITVSDKRVYGINAGGKTVDLPIDSISSVSSSKHKGVVVSSSSGKYKFFGLSNREEVHKAITDLLMERQNNPKSTAEIKQEIQQSSADELAKFKDLLDKGIISQEEFDAKKKQLLGL